MTPAEITRSLLLNMIKQVHALNPQTTRMELKDLILEILWRKRLLQNKSLTRYLKDYYTHDINKMYQNYLQKLQGDQLSSSMVPRM